MLENKSQVQSSDIVCKVVSEVEEYKPLCDVFYEIMFFTISILKNVVRISFMHNFMLTLLREIRVLLLVML